MILKNKKRVLFVGAFAIFSQSVNNTGGQIYASRTLIESSLKESIDWVLLDSTTENNLGSSLFKRATKALLRVFKLLYHLLFHRIDMVLIFTADGPSFWEKGLMAVISKLFGKRVLLAPRSGFIKNDIEKDGYLKKFIGYVFGVTDYVICQGDSWKHYFQSYFPAYERKFVVINNWIDYTQYHKANLNKTDDATINILFLAWVDKTKGIYELIEAAKILVEQTKNIKFIIAGYGKDFDKAVSLVNQYSLTAFFEFKGWVIGADKIDLLSKCDIFVLPSYGEGFPNALMEAMSSGLSVVVTDVGSVKDAITNAENGYLIEPKNIEQLVNALRQLVNDKNKRIKLADKAYQLIKTKYSLQEAVTRFERILQ